MSTHNLRFRNIRIMSESFHFLVAKLSIYLNTHVFVNPVLLYKYIYSYTIYMWYLQGFELYRYIFVMTNKDDNGVLDETKRCLTFDVVYTVISFTK